jgi:formylmethanofuran dehydrogenase subunit E
MNNLPIDAELQAAKRFHGHLGPYLVVGMRAGHFIASVFGDKPFSYRIHATVGTNPPPSCVLDGLQITTPCTVGNSMLRAEPLDVVRVWAEKDSERLELILHPDVQQKIDTETNRSNEEQKAQEIWEEAAEALFIIKQYTP